MFKQDSCIIENMLGNQIVVLDPQWTAANTRPPSPVAGTNRHRQRNQKQRSSSSARLQSSYLTYLGYKGQFWVSYRSSSGRGSGAATLQSSRGDVVGESGRIVFLLALEDTCRYYCEESIPRGINRSFPGCDFVSTKRIAAHPLTLGTWGQAGSSMRSSQVASLTDYFPSVCREDLINSGQRVLRFQQLPIALTSCQMHTLRKIWLCCKSCS